MSHLSTSARRHRSQHIFSVLLGILWIASTIEGYQQIDSSQTQGFQSRKLLSSPEPEPELDGNFSREDLQKLLTILEGSSKEGRDASSGAIEHAATFVTPELMRLNTKQQPRLRAPSSTLSTITTTTTTATDPPVRHTTRRFYRRLRRKPASTTETPTSTTEAAPVQTTVKVDEVTQAIDSILAESPRLIESGPTPGDLLQQLSLLNGILGALNASSASAPTAMSIIATSSESNANDYSNVTPVPDLLAFLTGAKQIAEASSQSEVIVPPPAPSPTTGQMDDPAAALALFNLFSNSQNKGGSSNEASSSAAANLLNLVAQSQMAAQATTPPAPIPDVDATAALTKLLLQSSVSAPSPTAENSLNQAQRQSNNAAASANQLNNLIGLLGALGNAGAGQQSQAGGINNLFNLGGDQVAQAQTNSLATLFNSQQQQPAQTQNLLNLFGGNQGNQGFNLASLLAPQTGNSIPGLGLLSTMTGLGSSIFSSVSNIFGGNQVGKPRVRGKGVDTRVGLGYRLGNVGDAQVVWEIGPQLFTDPLRNENRPYTKKRESGLPSPSPSSHYFQPSVTTAQEKEMQKVEANRRMVQAAIQERYRNNHFASAYPNPQPSRRSSNYGSTKKSSTGTALHNSSSSLLSVIPFGDHLRGFWSGLTSGMNGNDNDEHTSYYDFDDVKTDFSNNLMKRSSPDYTDYESRAYHPRRRDEDINDPTHSTLTEYERLLLQYGKGIGETNTDHDAVDDAKSSSDSGFFSRWFKGSSSLTPKTQTPRTVPSSQRSEWAQTSDDYPVTKSTSVPTQSYRHSHSQSSSSPGPYGVDFSFNRRNDVQGRSNGNRRRGNQRPHPPRRRTHSHNPFRNWISSFKPQKPRHQPQQAAHSSYSSGGFGRRYFKRPSAPGNPKLQHFTNMNKDLLMADANDDFVESAGVESYAPRYQQPLSYKYEQEFPDVSLTQSQRARQSHGSSKTRASFSYKEKIVEPALLYDHLEVKDDNGLTEADESFHNRNKVVVNPELREREKEKVLGKVLDKATTKHQQTITKIQRLRNNNASRNKTMKQRIVVKSRGKSQQTHTSSATRGDKDVSTESTTAFPSVMSTISSLFSGTTNPKLKTLLRNATSYFPSIRILPRKKDKEDNIGKTKLTMQNGKPSIIVPLTETEDEDEDYMEEAADEMEPVVQVGHDMSFTDLKSVFGANAKNNTKRRRFRIRVKESVLKGNKDDKNRRDSEEDEGAEGGTKDIFVDIESGEVSVLKPVASLISFDPKKEESSDEEDIDYYEDDDGDGVADADMNRKEHIFDAIQKELVRNFEKMKKAELRAQAKKRRKQELAEKGMDESIDDVTKYFDLLQNSSPRPKSSSLKLKQVGGLSL